MKTRIDVIQFLIDRFGFKSYLEVGVQYMVCWNEIKCDHKVGVEPNKLPDPRIHEKTSDQYFAVSQEKFDIIFIDGDHTYPQVIKDIRNALDRLNEGGILVCHDSFPMDKEHTNPYLNGTVYEAICEIRSEEGYDFCTFEEDHGVCAIRKGNMEPYPCKGISYEDFYKNAKEILNLKNADGFKAYYA